MKRIVYLTFYFQPDLCAGSFRNSPLAFELAQQAKYRNIIIDLYTTLPNRYSTFSADAPMYEELENLRIHRIALPAHKSGMIDQIFSFFSFYSEVLKLNKGKKADLVFASSSRLFTAYLGYIIAKKSTSLLYLDIRDIFVDTMGDVLKLKLVKKLLLPVLRYVEIKTFNYATHINLISGGFKAYFEKFNNISTTFYSNGIDNEFLTNSSSLSNNTIKNVKKRIVYAGNLGEGQGLHKIIPESAKLLGDNFEFLIIGDGGTKNMLKSEIIRLELKNVIIQNPINRKELQEVYKNADFLFLHLNDYPAFNKVLPSKIFELATFNKPILAGVAGFSAEFISKEVPYSFVFEPCNINRLVSFLKEYTEKTPINRAEFINKYKRSRINEEMTKSILSYV